MATTNVDTHAFQRVPIKSLATRRNIRDRLVEEEQIGLTQSIKQSGILVPLLGHCEGPEIVVDDGHRRLDAARRAGLDTVPMIVAERAPTPAEIITIQLVANCQRTGLKTMERTRAIDQLITETGWPAAEVSLRLGGPSASTISKLLALLVLPQGVQDLVDAGRIPMSSAYAIATVKDAAERERLVGEILNGRVTRDQLVADINVGKKHGGRVRPRNRAKSNRSRIVVPLGQGCSIAVSGSGQTLQTFVSWLQGLLNRIRSLEPQDMELGDAVKALAAPKA